MYVWFFGSDAGSLSGFQLEMLIRFVPGIYENI